MQEAIISPYLAANIRAIAGGLSLRQRVKHFPPQFIICLWRGGEKTNKDRY
ncbi:hypothetical protein [Candidatus Sodalis sp. SoCistrobi]|uniref:hypothetical protein n=1 Tax=Candidatus Sodalis sp. SoCistrobi TaxID=1922216 RepID=UPI001576AE65|nr:hypothetical protein [Candidatus Sodalis sp. SoCistrobi]